MSTDALDQRFGPLLGNSYREVPSGDDRLPPETVNLYERRTYEHVVVEICSVVST